MTTQAEEEPEMPRQSLARRTIARLVEGMDSGPSAAITQVIQLIQEITAKADTISVDQLSELVGRDLAAMTKVLSVANTIGFNPSGAEVSTVHQAIQTIGFDKVLNIAIALLLLESCESGAAGKEKQNVSALALASGTLAQAILEQRGGADPDQAFVCAALRSYGQLLLVNFLPEEFQRARDLQTDSKQIWDSCCRGVFGLSSLQTGLEMLSLSQVSKSLLNTLRPVSLDLVNSKIHSSADLLLIVGEFSTRFCEQVASGTGDLSQMKKQALQLAGQYGVGLALDEAALDEIFERTERKLSSFGKAHGLKGFSSSLIKRLVSGGTKSASHGSRDAPTSCGAAASLSGTEGRGLQRMILQLGLESGGPRPSLQDALAPVLEMLHEELNLAQSVVFLRDEILPTWSARVGRGTLFTSIRSQPLLSTESKNIFTICLVRGEDVLIQSPNEPSIRKYVPEWLLRPAKDHPLLLLSLKDSTGTFGVICGLAASERSLGLTSQFAAPLKELRTALASLDRVDIAA